MAGPLIPILAASLGGQELFRRRGAKKERRALEEVIGAPEEQLPAGQEGPPRPATGAFGTVEDPALRGQLGAARGLLGTTAGRAQTRSLLTDVFKQQQLLRRQTAGLETQERLARERIEAQRAGKLGLTESGQLQREKFIQAETKDLRNNFQKLSNNYLTARQAVDQVRKAIGSGAGFGKIAALQTFIKALDPGGRVTEGEVQVTTGAAGLFQSLKAEVERIAGTGAVLTDAAAQNLLAAAEAILMPLAADFETLRAQFQQEAVRRELDPRSIFVGTIFDPEQAQENRIPIIDNTIPGVEDL